MGRRQRLVERGARTTSYDEATLGLLDRLAGDLPQDPPRPEEINHAFWGACHGGRVECAEYLRDRGAEINWVRRGSRSPRSTRPSDAGPRL